MTDPLTGKQLVEKSYEYIERLTRECAKVVVEDFSKTHRKLDQESFWKETGNAVIQWFQKRERNIEVSLASGYILQQQPNTAHINLKGHTKDADFTISATVGTFVVPSQEKPSVFLKTLVFSVEKQNFSRRKP
ncbi:MAG: hypothetical protein ACYCQJ_08150 [Nitrososphaerales archaeon]